ncbi:MAG: sodium:alanine symporter family protein [Chlamydiales bacterium]|nr:sodium:alanine symporter family protein [Chlamydiia bacterium]MCP5508307.1 sodium:alanine symporter family protein [Chlamydiales bacterium]
MEYVVFFEDILWGLLGVPIIVGLGLFFTWRSRVVQVRKFPAICREFIGFLSYREEGHGVHPLKAFFACVGGCIGIGNIVAVCTAVQIGGPGALFWLWVTAFLGMMLKYAEVFLGIRYRELLPSGEYHGGPMYFLRPLFRTPAVPRAVALLLCIYGVEIYQFRVVTQSIVVNWEMNEFLVIGLLLGMVLFASLGGVSRVGSISSAIIPLFVIIYVSMGMWVLFGNYHVIPAVLGDVFIGAFTGQGAVGGAVGSALMVTLSQGVRRGAYTGDVGIGYASVIHSESSEVVPQRQAALVIMDMFLDTFVVCTMTLMMVLVTGVWKQPLEAGQLIQAALAQYFPYMHFFMPFFLFLLGYSTINAYFIVGVRCAEYLSKEWGRCAFYLYAVAVLILFSFANQTTTLHVMAIVGGLLLLINSYGIVRHRKEVDFSIDL